MCCITWWGRVAMRSGWGPQWCVRLWGWDPRQLYVMMMVGKVKWWDKEHVKEKLFGSLWWATSRFVCGTWVPKCTSYMGPKDPLCTGYSMFMYLVQIHVLFMAWYVVALAWKACGMGKTLRLICCLYFVMLAKPCGSCFLASFQVKAGSGEGELSDAWGGVLDVYRAVLTMRSCCVILM